MGDLVVPSWLATYDPLGPPPGEPLMTGHNGLVYHTMAGSFVGTDAWVHQDGWSGTEGTFGIAGSGFCKEWVPWNRQADHALDGNKDRIGFEFADAGESFPPLSSASDESPPMTAAQLEKGVQLAVYLCDVRNHQQCPSTWRCHSEGIPVRFIANSCERGIGCHFHGIEGRGLVAGCPRWSLSKGKICNRMVRLRQVRDYIVPETARRLGRTPLPPAPVDTGDDDLTAIINQPGTNSWYVTDWIHASQIFHGEDAAEIIWITVASGGKIACRPDNGPLAVKQSNWDRLIVVTTDQEAVAHRTEAKVAETEIDVNEVQAELERLTTEVRAWMEAVDNPSPPS